MAQLTSKHVLTFLQIIMQTIVTVSFASASELRTTVTRSELQWAICDSNISTIFDTLALKVSKSKFRHVYYLETVNMDFYRNGVVTRIRVDTSLKTSVKKNFFPSLVPWTTMQNYQAECEEDVYSDLTKVGCSQTDVQNVDIDLFHLSSKQIAYLNAVGVTNELSAAKIWGPLEETVYKATSDDGAEIEISVIDDSFELSLRVPYEQKQRFLNQWNEKLQSSSLKLCPLQSGKTGRLLQRLISKPATN